MWNLSSSVHIDIERVSAANEWDIECEHSISLSVHVFCLLYKHTNNDVFDDFQRFPTTFWRFPKIFQSCSEGLTNISEHFPNIFRRLPRVAEDCRGGTDDVSIIQHHLWVLFKRSCYAMAILRLVTTTWYFYTWKYRIFTCENIGICSVAEILIKHWCLYNKGNYLQHNHLARVATMKCACF